MIKIDLGKEGEDSSNRQFKFISQLISKLPKGGGGGSPSDSAGVLFLVVVSALALLPYFFVKSLKAAKIAEHQEFLQQTDTKIESIKQELIRFAAFEAEMKSYEEQKARIVQRIETVNQLLKTRNAPVNVLDAVGQSLPQKTWVTGLDFVTTPNPKITLTGQAYANEDISDFLDKITESVYLTEVSLDSVTPVKVEGSAEIKAFEISAQPREIGANEVSRQTNTTTAPNSKEESK